MASIFVFGTEGTGPDGTRYTQSACVCAGSLDEATALLEHQLANLQAEGADPRAPEYSPDDWIGEEVPLDAPKIVNIVSTRWPTA